MKNFTYLMLPKSFKSRRLSVECAPEPADDEDDAVVFEAAPRTLDVCALPIAKGNCRASKIRYGMVFTKCDLIISNN